MVESLIAPVTVPAVWLIIMALGAALTSITAPFCASVIFPLLTIAPENLPPPVTRMPTRSAMLPVFVMPPEKVLTAETLIPKPPRSRSACRY